MKILKNKKILYILISILVLGFIALGFFVLMPAITSSAEFVADFGSKKELKSSDGRTNILVIGLDKREDKYIQTGNLTDTMIVASIDPLNRDVKLVSLPRDLWVVVDGRGSKINEVLTIHGFDKLSESIENALGIKIHYTAKVDFQSFEKIIDKLGGVEIENPVAFTDNFYPKFGWENETCGLDVETLKEDRLAELVEENEDAKLEDVVLSERDFPCRFERITFEQGTITLGGEDALKYARSRHSLDNNQGNDFARAKRQHLIIFGVLNKALSTEVITNPNKVRELFLEGTKFIETDFSTAELMVTLPLIADAKNFELKSAVLQAGNPEDVGSVLVQGNPDDYNGLYVLVPEKPSSVINFINDYFYSETALEDSENAE